MLVRYAMCFHFMRKGNGMYKKPPSLPKGYSWVTTFGYKSSSQGMITVHLKQRHLLFFKQVCYSQEFIVPVSGSVFTGQDDPQIDIAEIHSVMTRMAMQLDADILARTGR